MARVKTYLRRNDRVMVIAGKDKGKVGKVLRIAKNNRAYVEGVNMVKRHLRAAPGRAAGIVEKEASIHISNLMLVCPKCTDPVRIGKKILDDGSKVRVCKKCGEAIPTEKA